MKTRNSVLAVLVMVVALMFSGCAANHRLGAMPTLSRIDEKKLAKTEKDGVAVTVYPVRTAEESKEYFDENLLAERIFPVYMSIFNKTQHTARMLSVNLVVGGKTIPPLMKERVYKAMRKDIGWRAFLWTAPTFYIGAIPSAIHTNAVNSDIEKDIEIKQFRVREDIKSMSSSDGFFWFEIPKENMPDGVVPTGTPLAIVMELVGESSTMYDILLE